jgi:hypothetical protein
MTFGKLYNVTGFYTDEPQTSSKTLAWSLVYDLEITKSLADGREAHLVVLTNDRLRSHIESVDLKRLVGQFYYAWVPSV